MTTHIRMANPADSQELLEIYAPYVRDTAVTFEIDVPAPAQFAARIEGITSQYPFLVWEENGHLLAYAYASSHRTRAAYQYDVESSIYAALACQGRGVAGRLYACLFDILREQGYRNVYAGYALPNPKSMRFHEKCGFEPIGIYRKTGYKAGKWHDTTWTQKVINPYSESPGPITPIHELSPSLLDGLFRKYGCP